jgi:WhiB family redox-sensing transcriptional regulator
MAYRPPEWMKKAACLGEDVDDFFPADARRAKDTRGIRRARELCESCPVIDECFEFGLKFGSTGIWGGRTQSELWAERRKRSAPAISA